MVNKAMNKTHLKIMQDSNFYLNLRINILRDYLIHKYNFTPLEVMTFMEEGKIDMAGMSNKKLKSFTINISEMKKSEPSEIINILRIYARNKKALDQAIKDIVIEEKTEKGPKQEDFTQRVEKELEVIKTNSKQNVMFLHLMSDKYAKTPAEKKLMKSIALRVANDVSLVMEI